MKKSNDTPNNIDVGIGGITPAKEVPPSLTIQKNMIMGGVVFLLILVATGVFFFLTAGNALDMVKFKQDEMVLSAINNDLHAFSKEDVLLEEINQTLGDILDEVAGIPIEDALDLSSIDAEASQVDLSETLDAFDVDSMVSQELDLIFDEVLQ